MSKNTNTTQFMILLRCILTLFLAATYFGSSYEPSSGLLLVLSKVKYIFSNAVVIVTYEATITIALLIVYFKSRRQQ